MSRSGKVNKRPVLSDPQYSSRLVAKLISVVMKDGKKLVASKQVYKAFEEIEKKEKKEALEVFRQALENIKPTMEVRSRRVGGAAYQVPMPVRGNRRESLALRWIVLGARKRPNNQYQTFSQKLAAELIDAYHNSGVAIEKRQQIEKMADANKAFSHFRW